MYYNEATLTELSSNESCFLPLKLQFLPINVDKPSVGNGCKITFLGDVKLKLFRLYIFINIFFSSVLGFASPSSVVFQGQILKPNGEALEAPNVNFTLQVLSTTDECLLHEETTTLNMSNSAGIFSLSLGSGTNTTNGGLSNLSEALDNSLANQTGLTTFTVFSYPVRSLIASLI